MNHARRSSERSSSVSETQPGKATWSTKKTLPLATQEGSSCAWEYVIHGRVSEPRVRSTPFKVDLSLVRCDEPWRWSRFFDSVE